MQGMTEERSLGELFGDLSRELGTLVRNEAELAKTELTAKAQHVGKSMASLAIGGAVLYAGVLAVMAAVILLLATLGLPAWISALLVGAVVLGVGWLLVRRGLELLRQTDLAPRQTVESLKENVQWAKEQTK